MPLATQTWAQSAVTAVPGSGDTVAEVLGVVKSLIDSDSSWNVGSDGTAATPPYLEIVSAAPMGAAGQIFKLLLVNGNTIDADWTVGDTGNWAAGGDFDYGSGTGAKAAQDMYVGFTAPPSDGTSTTASLNTGNIFNATGPYGGTAASTLTRFSSFVKTVNNVADTGNNYNIANVWTVSCAEMLALAFEDTLGRIKVIMCGAMIAPLSDAAGETVSSGVGRIFAMTTTHSFAGLEPDPVAPDSILWGNTSSTTQANGGGWTPEPNSNAGIKSAQSIMLAYYPEDNSLRPAYNLLSGIPSRQTGNVTANITGLQNGALMDTAGNLAALPIPVVDGTLDDRLSVQLLGIMRQIKVINNSLSRGTVQNGAGATVGLALTGSRTSVAQGFLLSNS